MLTFSKNKASILFIFASSLSQKQWGQGLLKRALCNNVALRGNSSCNCGFNTDIT